MKFTITFAANGNRHSVQRLMVGGLELADPALTAGVPLGQIPQCLTHTGSYVDIDVDIDTARKSGLFVKEASATVDVKPLFGVKDYAYIHAEWNPSTEKSVIEWRIDKERLLQDWIEAGYPAVWDRTQSD